MNKVTKINKKTMKEQGKNLEVTNRIELERRVGELLDRGVVEVIDREHLRSRLLSGETLRVKFGIDPTGPQYPYR